MKRTLLFRLPQMQLYFELPHTDESLKGRTFERPSYFFEHRYRLLGRILEFKIGHVIILLSYLTYKERKDGEDSQESFRKVS